MNVQSAPQGTTDSFTMTTSEAADALATATIGVTPTLPQTRPLSFTSMAMRQIERQSSMIEKVGDRVESGLMQNTRIETMVDQNLGYLLIALGFIGFLLLVAAFELGGLLIALLHVIAAGG